MKDIFKGDIVELITGMLFKVVTSNKAIGIIVVSGSQSDFEINYDSVLDVYKREIK